MAYRDAAFTQAKTFYAKREEQICAALWRTQLKRKGRPSRLRWPWSDGASLREGVPARHR